MNKNLLRLGMLFFAVISFSFSAFSQTDTSNRGTEFWVAYGHHQFMETSTNTQNMVLYLSTGNQPATVTITLDSSGPLTALWWRKTYNIPANSVIVSDVLPKGSVNASASNSDPNFDARLIDQPNSSSGLFRKKGFRIESNVPIVAYSHIYGSASSGATMLVPVEAWGGLYTSVNSKQSYASNCFSWCYVIAKYDNTVIEITPSVITRAQDKTGLQPGVASTVTLMKGQIYQVMGANISADANGNGGTNSAGYELTGTKIMSVMSPTGYIHPIAVFSGSSRTFNAATCGSGGGDNDMQQHYPRQAWGRKYLTAPSSSGAGVSSFMTQVYKITVTDPTTIVYRNGIVLSGLVNNTYYTYESNTADIVEADKPVLVAQFMTGGGCTPGSVGDPEMFYLSPISQAINDAVFYRTTRENISMNFVTLIIPTNGVSSLTIDGSSTFDLTYAHPQLAGYSVVVKKWAPSSNSQSVIHSDSAFTGLTYGLGSVESYGYNLGCHLNAVNARDASVLPPGFTGALPLPVTLLSFSGSRKEYDVVLNWATTNEINFDRYEVERSFTGAEFNTIDMVQAKQALQANYNSIDIHAAQYFNGYKTLYYRLKMIDKDGKFTYSKIISVRADKNIVEIKVMPNPFVDKLQVKLNTENAGQAKLTLRDISGRTILTQSEKISLGNNTLDIARLAVLQKGTYLLEVELNGSRQYYKVVK